MGFPMKPMGKPLPTPILTAFFLHISKTKLSGVVSTRSKTYLTSLWLGPSCRKWDSVIHLQQRNLLTKRVAEFPQDKQNVGREEDIRTKNCGREPASWWKNPSPQAPTSTRPGEVEAPRKASALFYLNGPMGDSKN